MKKAIFGIVGAILGLPLSYYFQPEMVQQKIGGLGGYIQNFDTIVSDKSLIGNVITGVIVFGIIGLVFGYFLDENAKKQTS